MIEHLQIVDCIKRKSLEEKQNVLKHLVEDITMSVNKTVMKTQTKQKRRKKVDLPSAGDIKKVKKLFKPKNYKWCEKYK